MTFTIIYIYIDMDKWIIHVFNFMTCTNNENNENFPIYSTYYVYMQTLESLYS